MQSLATAAARGARLTSSGPTATSIPPSNSTTVAVASHGRKMHVTEYGITGLAFEPTTVWLDDDQHFFGSPSKWFAFLREGWEDTNDQLYALDRKAQDARNERLASELASHPRHA